MLLFLFARSGPQKENGNIFNFEVIILQTVIEALRRVLGVPDFYKNIGGYNNPTWDYGAMLEYFVAALVLLIVISSVFRFLNKFFK